MYKKRERTQNWTPEEKRYLLELCEKRLDVLENKKIDSASSSLKCLTWKFIHSKFGARFGLERDVQRLREQWRRMKGHAKNEMYNYSQYEKRFGPEAVNPQQRPSTLSAAIWRSLGVSKPGDTGADAGEALDSILATALQGTSGGPSQQTPDTQRSISTSPSLSDEDGLVIDIKEELIEPIVDIEEDMNSCSQDEDRHLYQQQTRLNNDIAPPIDSNSPNMEINCSNVFANKNYQITSPPSKKSLNIFTLEMFKMKVAEQKRRLSMMEEEHKIKMEILELKRDTKRMKREMALAEQNKINSVRFGSDQLGSMGSGAGKGGGGGGAIREAGGAFGKLEAAREEEFFYKQQREQLLKLKTDLKDEINFHEEQVKRHQEAIERHTQRVHDIESKQKH